MSVESLTIVVFVLGAVVLLTMALVFALARQIGILHTRLAPAGALTTSEGPTIGEAAPKLALRDMSNRPVQIGGPAEQPTLVLFVSPTCPICKELLPVAQSVAKRERLTLLFASDGEDLASHERYVENMALENYPYLLSSELGMTLGASKLPFAVLIDSDGILKARGLVNSREHLESMVEAMISGYHSLQDFMVKEQQLEQAS